MKLKINSIITLENQEKYIVLSETFYEGHSYFLVMGLDQNKEIISSKVAIFKEENEDGEIYVSKVEDASLVITLTKILKAQL